MPADGFPIDHQTGCQSGYSPSRVQKPPQDSTSYTGSEERPLEVCKGKQAERMGQRDVLGL